MFIPKAAVVWVSMKTGWFGRLLSRVVFAVFPSWRSK